MTLVILACIISGIVIGLPVARVMARAMGI